MLISAYDFQVNFDHIFFLQNNFILKVCDVIALLSLLTHRHPNNIFLTIILFVACSRNYTSSYGHLNLMKDPNTDCYLRINISSSGEHNQKLHFDGDYFPSPYRSTFNCDSEYMMVSTYTVVKSVF